LEVIGLEKFSDVGTHDLRSRLPFVFENLVDEVIGDEKPKPHSHGTDAKKAIKRETGGKTRGGERACSGLTSDLHRPSGDHSFVATLAPHPRGGQTEV
jgi:hypothetical protein